MAPAKNGMDDDANGNRNEAARRALRARLEAGGGSELPAVERPLGDVALGEAGEAARAYEVRFTRRDGRVIAACSEFVGVRGWGGTEEEAEGVFRSLLTQTIAAMRRADVDVPPPGANREQMVTKCVKMESSLADEAQRVARDNDWSFSQLVRLSVREYLQSVPSRKD